MTLPRMEKSFLGTGKCRDTKEVCRTVETKRNTKKKKRVPEVDKSPLNKPVTWGTALNLNKLSYLVRVMIQGRKRKQKET
jgi:hypothetical protein